MANAWRRGAPNATDVGLKDSGDEWIDFQRNGSFGCLHHRAGENKRPARILCSGVVQERARATWAQGRLGTVEHWFQLSKGHTEGPSFPTSPACGSEDCPLYKRLNVRRDRGPADRIPNL